MLRGLRSRGWVETRARLDRRARRRAHRLRDAGRALIYRARGFRLVAREPHESFGAKLVGEERELALGRLRAPAK